MLFVWSFERECVKVTNMTLFGNIKQYYSFKSFKFDSHLLTAPYETLSVAAIKGI